MSPCFFPSPRVFIPAPTVVCGGRVVPGQRFCRNYSSSHYYIPRPPAVRIDLGRSCSHRCWPRAVSYPHYPVHPPVLMPVNPFMRLIAARPLIGRIGIRF